MLITEENLYEQLSYAKENLGLYALKCDFEAEGSSLEEVSFFRDVASKAEISLALKIGGCEAIRNLTDAKELNADVLVAPMIESSYAVKKFQGAVDRCFDSCQKKRFLCNIETIQAIKNLDEILDEIEKSAYLEGVVVGRVDLAASQGLERSKINGDIIDEQMMMVSQACEQRDLVCVIGGSIDTYALNALAKITYLHFFETRKTVFCSSVLSTKNADRALRFSLQLELWWLRELTKSSEQERLKYLSRIELLETRLAS